MFTGHKLVKEDNVRKDVKLSVFSLSPHQTPDSRISHDLRVNNVRHGHLTFNWNTIIDAVSFFVFYKPVNYRTLRAKIHYSGKNARMIS